MLVMSLIGGSLLTFQFLLAFALVLGWLMLLALLYVSLFDLLVGWTLLIGPPHRPLVSSRMSGMFIWMSLGWFLKRLFLLSWMLSLGLLLTIFGLFGVGMPRRVYFGLIPKLEVPLKLAALPFLAEICYGFVAGVPSTLLTLPLLLYSSFVGALSLWRMCSKILGVRVLLLLGGTLFWVIGRLFVVMVRVVLLHPWDKWIPPDFDSLEVLNGFPKQVVVSRRDLGIR